MRHLTAQEFSDKHGSARRLLPKVLARVYPPENRYLDSFELGLADMANRQIALPEPLPALTQESILSDLMRSISEAKPDRPFTFRHPLFKERSVTLAANDFTLYGEPPQIYAAPDAQIALGKYFDGLREKMPDSAAYFGAVATLQTLKAALQKSASLARPRSAVSKGPVTRTAKPAPLFDANTPTLASLIAEGDYSDMQAAFIRNEVTRKAKGARGGEFKYNGVTLNAADFELFDTKPPRVAGESARILRSYFVSHKESLKSVEPKKIHSLRMTEPSDEGFTRSR